jgi:hypothetical protein
MNEKFFKSIARLQKRVARLYATGIISVRENGVQVVDEIMVEISKFAEIAVRDDGTNHFPWEARAIVDGVVFFAIGSEEEFIEAGIFDVVAKQDKGGE